MKKRGKEVKRQRSKENTFGVFIFTSLLLASLLLLTGCSKEYFAAKYYMVKAENAYNKAHAMRVKTMPREERLAVYREARDCFLKAYQSSPGIFNLNLIELAHDACLRVGDQEGVELFAKFAQEYSSKHPTEVEYGDATPLVGLE